MLVRHFMSRTVLVLRAEITCSEAWSEFQERGLRRAPVMEKGHILGMLTDRDLMRVLPWSLRQIESASAERSPDRPVRDILASKLICVAPGDHLETAATLMMDHKIGGLPVIDNGKLVGIITESDLFRTFVNLKLHTEGSRLTLHWPKGHGSRPDAARIALAAGVQMREYIEHPSPGEGLLLDLRIAGNDVDGFVERILGAGYLLLDRKDASGD
jgi:acetoin utilization protein AcuB